MPSVMLRVKALDSVKNKGIKRDHEYNLYLVDSHHHMGRESGHQNTPSTAYEFYTLLWFELKRAASEMKNNDRLLFKPIDVQPLDFVSDVYSIRKSWRSLSHGWLVDRTVVFPYTDDYSLPTKKGRASFEVSNERISGWTTRSPHSSRLIGFGRVNPSDAEQTSIKVPVGELDRCVSKLGLRGLKLHPLAQLFLEDIESNPTKQIVKRAATHKIPIIFDTRNIKTVMRIHNLVRALETEDKSIVENLRIILAHCGMSPADSRLYDALSHPCIFADTSSLHGQDVPLLFENAFRRLPTFWSDKLLFGTDYSFLTVQAIDVILYLLSKQFPGTLIEAQKILAGNILRLIGRPFSRNTGKTPPQRLLGPLECGSTRKGIEQEIIRLIKSKAWSLASIDFMLPPNHTWPEIQPITEGGENGIYKNSMIVSLIDENNDEVQIWIHELPDNLIGVVLSGTNNMYCIDTLEYSSQALQKVLTQELVAKTIYVKDSKSLAREIFQRLS